MDTELTLSLLQLSTESFELLGPLTCHHCPGFIRLWAPASSNFKPKFHAYFVSDCFEIEHTITLYTLLSPISILAKSLENWSRYRTFQSSSPPNIKLVYFSSDSRTIVLKPCVWLLLYTINSLKNFRVDCITRSFGIHPSCAPKQTCCNSLDFDPIGPQLYGPHSCIAKSTHTEFCSDRTTRSLAICVLNFPHYYVLCKS